MVAATVLVAGHCNARGYPSFSARETVRAWLIAWGGRSCMGDVKGSAREE